MPLPATTPGEQRLALVSRLDGWAHVAMALVLALAPGLAFRLFALGQDGGAVTPMVRLFAALAAGGSLALGLQALAVAREPRTERTRYFPCLASHAVCAAIGLAARLWPLGLAALGLALVGLWAYQGAAPGMNLGPSLAPPAEPPVQAPVQLGTRKAASDVQ